MNSLDLVDQLSPEEREERIKAAIAELERNPNASRRGVARNHGLPESTLRGRMKKLHITYKNYNKDDFSVHRGGSPAQTRFAAQQAGHQGALGRNSGANHSFSGAGSGLNQRGGAVRGGHDQGSNSANKAGSDFTQNMYGQYYKKARYSHHVALSQQRQSQAGNVQQQHQQQQQQQQRNTVPDPVIAPYRPPPNTQLSNLEFHARIDRTYQPDTEPDSLREIKPSTLNTLPKKMVPVKVLQNNMIKFDETFGDGSEEFDVDGTAGTEVEDLVTEKPLEEKERLKKIDEIVEELYRNPQYSIRYLSRKHQIAESAIRRALIEKKTPIREYCLSDELETRLLKILKNYSFINDTEYLKKILNDLITSFIKQDYFSQHGNLKEMLDNERIEEIGIEFLWKFGYEVVGSVKLSQLID